MRRAAGADLVGGEVRAVGLGRQRRGRLRIGHGRRRAAPDAVQVLARGDELSSPYVTDGELDLRAWARDALVLALPAQITCRPDCAGLCPQCGENLNEHPDHAHEREPDPRWAKLSELKLTD